MAAGFALADIVSYSNTVSLTSGEDAVVSLNQFNSSLGTLTGITLEFRVVLSGAQFEFDNDNAASRNVQADFSGLVDAFSMDTRWDAIDDLIADLYVADSRDFSLSATTGDQVGEFNATGAGDYYNWVLGTLNGSFSDSVNSAYFSDYTGLGSFDSTMNFVEEASHSPTYRVFRNETLPTGELTAIVTYEYAIPEPAAMGLIVMGGFITFAVNRLIRRRV